MQSNFFGTTLFYKYTTYLHLLVASISKNERERQRHTEREREREKQNGSM